MTRQQSDSIRGAAGGSRLTARPSSIPVLFRTLRWSFLVAAGIALVASITGFLVAEWAGAISGFVGAAMAAVFLGITAVSIVVANRFDIAAFFAIVLGSWLAKCALFLALAFALRGQPWVNAPVLFLTLIAGVIGSLVVDVIVVARSRVATVSDVVLPGDNNR